MRLAPADLMVRTPLLNPLKSEFTAVYLEFTKVAAISVIIRATLQEYKLDFDC